MQGRGGEKRKGYAKIPPNSGHSFHSIIGTCLAVLFVGSFFGLLAFCCGRWRSFDLLLCLFCCGQLKHYRLLALFVSWHRRRRLLLLAYFYQVCGDGGEERRRERDPSRAGSCHRIAVRFRSETRLSEFVRDYSYYCLLCGVAWRSM